MPPNGPAFAVYYGVASVSTKPRVVRGQPEERLNMGVMREKWKNGKKDLPIDIQKQFKEDLGPRLDKAEEAYAAVKAEKSRDYTRKDKNGKAQKFQCHDLKRIADLIDKGLPIMMKASKTVLSYQILLEKLKFTKASVPYKALSVIEDDLDDKIKKMRNSRPSDALVKQYLIQNLNGVFEASFPGFKSTIT